MRINKITSQFQPTTIPQVNAPLNLNTGFAAGLGSFGEAIGEAGAVFGEIQRRKKEYENDALNTEFEGDVKIELNELTNQISTLPYEEIEAVRKAEIERMTGLHVSAVNVDVQRLVQTDDPVDESEEECDSLES